MTLENSVSAGGARCAARRCRKCHGSRKSVRAWYVNAKRVEEWDNMSVDERRAIIRQNKDKGCGKGIKRQVKVSEKAECSDSLKLGQDKPFLTKKQLLVLLLCIALDFWIKQYYVIICCSFLANDAHICFVLNSTGFWQSWRRDTIGHRKIMKRNGRQQSQIPRRYGAKMTMEFQL